MARNTDMESKPRQQAPATSLPANAAKAGESRADLQLLVESVQDYAIFMLDPTGNIMTWNAGAQRLKGWAAQEIIGRNFSTFYPPEELATNKPARELEIAAAVGRYEEEGWRLRKSGDKFWANVVITRLTDRDGRIVGYGKVTRDLTERRQAELALREAHDELEKRVRERTQLLEAANKELEAFSYSVSHDLRAPLRSMDGFSNALLKQYGAKLDERATDYLNRIRASAQRMGQLIDDLLDLSRLSRQEPHKQRLDLSVMAHGVVAELRKIEPERDVEFSAPPTLPANGDPNLLHLVLQNLLDNAWKYSSTCAAARIEVGANRADDGNLVYFVRDNGVGFDMAFADKLFGAFQRLHSAEEFPGNGIGLATVKRIIHRHGGKIWAHGEPDKGATFYFTLPD
jgi:PAS domain S-box-containing protein